MTRVGARTLVQQVKTQRTCPMQFTVASVAQQFFKAFTGRCLAAVLPIFALPFPLHILEVFAEIGHMFFRHWIGATVAALMGHAAIVAGAIEADLKISTALVAILGPSRQTRQRVFPPTRVAVARQHAWKFSLKELSCQVRSKP